MKKPMETALAVYQVRLRRRTRRWAVEERYVRDATVRATAAQVAVQAPGARPFQPAGTLAAAAGMAWAFWATPAGAAAAGMTAWAEAGGADRLRAWAQALRALLRDDLTDPALADGLARLVGRRTQWLPLALDQDALVVSWAIDAPADQAFPWAAVYLSVLAGRFTGRLRLCRLCDAPFVAASWERVCEVCAHHRARRASPRVRRVIDRLRKRPDGARERAAALEALRTGMPLRAWLRTWDTRRGPQGKKPERGRRLSASRGHASVA
jgi:hypothetical protein